MITEQVRTDYRFSLLTLSFSCSVLSFHIASPSVTPLSLHFTFFGFFHSRLFHHRVTVVMAAHVASSLYLTSSSPKLGSQKLVWSVCEVWYHTSVFSGINQNVSTEVTTERPVR